MDPTDPRTLSGPARSTNFSSPGGLNRRIQAAYRHPSTVVAGIVGKDRNIRSTGAALTTSPAPSIQSTMNMNY